MNNDKLLTVGEYEISAGCRAVVRNGKVIITKRVKADEDVLRCRDCKHCFMGRSKYSQRYPHPVCRLQPKQNKGYTAESIIRQERFYAVRESDVRCEKFEQK